MSWRGCAWTILCVLPFFAYAEKDLETHLRGYEGRWVGHFTVHSTASGYSETFPVEQQYWLKDGELHGVAVTQREVGMSSARSKTVTQKNKFLSEVKIGDVVESYWGVLADGGLVWFSSDLKRTKDYQMKESIVEVDGQRVLKTEGFDTYVYDEGIAHLVYRGELKFVE